MEQPIEVMRGSKCPGDVLQKTLHSLGFRLNSGHKFRIPFFVIDCRSFSESRLPSKLAVPPQRLISVPWKNHDGIIECYLNDDGLAVLHLKLGGEVNINLGESLADFTYIDEAISAHGGSTVSTVAWGVTSILTDQIPIWGEVALVAAIASTIPRKRVRLLLEFNDRTPFVIETAEVVAILIDCIYGGGDDGDQSSRDEHVVEKSEDSLFETGGDVYVTF